MPECEPTSPTPEQPKVDSNPVNKSEIDFSFEPFDTSSLQCIKDIDEKIRALNELRKEYLQLVHFDSLGNARMEEDADGNSVMPMSGEDDWQNNLKPTHNNEHDDLIARMHANLEAQRPGAIGADAKTNK